MNTNEVINCVREHLDKWYASNNHNETAIQLVNEYEEHIRADAIRNFAEWLLHSSIYHGICNTGFMYGCDTSYAGHFHIADIYTVVAEYEKEQKGGGVNVTNRLT